MARILLCTVVLLGLTACTGAGDDAARERARTTTADLADARGRVARLRDRLAEARDRVDELERQTVIDRDRYVDLWSGGPTVRGTFLALPRLGVMRWTCHDNDGFRIVFEGRGASVRVAYDTPTASGARMVHPGKSLEATVGEGESVAWTITHRHKPGFIRAHVDVATARSRHGNCLLPVVRLEERGRLYD